MNAISNVLTRAVFEAPAEVHPRRAVDLFCSVGLVASLCLMTFGMDLSSAWL
jgi:hypothetical protein